MTQHDEQTQTRIPQLADIYNPAMVEGGMPRHAAPALRAPFAPAQAAVRALVPARQPGGAASEAQVLVTAILTTVDTLTANGEPVPSAVSDELRAQIARVLELVCSVDGPTGRADDPQRTENVAVRAWVQDAFRLLTAHLDM